MYYNADYAVCATESMSWFDATILPTYLNGSYRYDTGIGWNNYCTKDVGAGHVSGGRGTNN